MQVQRFLYDVPILLAYQYGVAARPGDVDWHMIGIRAAYQIEQVLARVGSIDVVHVSTSMYIIAYMMM